MSTKQTLTLRQELKRRLCRPLKNTTFIIYFVGMILAVGSLGVWLPNVIKLCQGKAMDWSSTANDLGIYSLAILSTVSVDTLLGEKELHKSLEVILILSLILVPIDTVLIAINPSLPLSICLSVLLTVYALLMYWMFNADREMFNEDHEGLVNNTVGDPTREPSGDLKGYKF